MFFWNSVYSLEFEKFILKTTNILTNFVSRNFKWISYPTEFTECYIFLWYVPVEFNCNFSKCSWRWDLMSYFNVTFDETLRNSVRRENVAIFLRANVSHQNVSLCLNHDIFSPISTIVRFFHWISSFISFNRSKISTWLFTRHH